MAESLHRGGLPNPLRGGGGGENSRVAGRGAKRPSTEGAQPKAGDRRSLTDERRLEGKGPRVAGYLTFFQSPFVGDHTRERTR